MTSPGDKVAPTPPGLEAVLASAYDELRALAAAHIACERPGHTFQPTDLAHDVYSRLATQHRAEWVDREQFLCVAATVIRRVLVDHARARHAVKRGGGRRRVPLGETLVLSSDETADVADLDTALAELAKLSERQARVVELKFFGGLQVPEIARALGVSDRTVELDWRFARAWLQERLHAGGDGPCADRLSSPRV